MAENKTIDNIITRLKESGRYDNVFRNFVYGSKYRNSSGNMRIMAFSAYKNKGYMLIFQYTENMEKKTHALEQLFRQDKLFRGSVDKIHNFLVWPDKSDKGYNVLWVKN